MSETSTHSVKKDSPLSLPVAIVAGAILISAAILFVGRGAGGAVAGGAKADIRTPTSQDHIIGSPDAPVLVVEYADLQCPYCNLIHPTLKKIVEESNGEVAWVFRHFPLESIHPEARPAAFAAECVAAQLGNEAFWKFVDELYANQEELGGALYAKKAAELGADFNRFTDCLNKKPYAARVAADLSEAVLNGGQGTPFTIVLGKKGDSTVFSGALPYEQIQAVINSIKNRQ